MKLFLKICGSIYFILLFYIFFLARRRPHPTLLKHTGIINLIPFKNKIDFLKTYNFIYPDDKWKFWVDLLGNIGLFIPLPFFLRFVFNIKNPWKIMLITIAASTCVELTQFIFSIGVADIDDVILNTTGAGLGVVFLILLKTWLPGLYRIFDGRAGGITG